MRLEAASTLNRRQYWLKNLNIEFQFYFYRIGGKSFNTVLGLSKLFFLPESPRRVDLGDESAPERKASGKRCPAERGDE